MAGHDGSTAAATVYTVDGNSSYPNLKVLHFLHGIPTGVEHSQSTQEQADHTQLL